MVSDSHQSDSKSSRIKLRNVGRGVGLTISLALLLIAMILSYGAWLNHRPLPKDLEKPLTYAQVAPRRRHKSVSTATSDTATRLQTAQRVLPPRSLAPDRAARIRAHFKQIGDALWNQPGADTRRGEYLTHFKISTPVSEWAPPPITPEETRWLRAQADILTPLRQALRELFADSPTPAARIGNFWSDSEFDRRLRQMAYLLANDPAARIGNFWSDSAFGLRLHLIGRLLATEGERCLNEHDSAGALECLRGLYWMACQPPSEQDPYLPFRMLPLANRFLQHWIEGPGMPANEAAQLQTDLESLEPGFFNPAIVPLTLEHDYRSQRDRLVALANRPWKSGEFGWDYKKSSDWASRRTDEKYFKVYDLDINDTFYTFRVFRPVPFLKTMLNCMSEKRRVPERIRECNRTWRGRLEVAGLSYPELHTLNQTEDVQWARYTAVTPLTMQTRLHLLRAALERITGRITPSDAIDFRVHPHHPWRDPFAEQSLHISKETTQTLIYSLGPDLTDEHGKVEFEKLKIEFKNSKPNVLPPHGDLTIRLPR